LAGCSASAGCSGSLCLLRRRRRDCTHPRDF
jgi:hypothetical protein